MELPSKLSHESSGQAPRKTRARGLEEKCCGLWGVACACVENRSVRPGTAFIPRISKDHSMPTRKHAEHARRKHSTPRTNLETYTRDVFTHTHQLSLAACRALPLSEALPSRPMRAWPYMRGECGAADANATPRAAPIRRPANRRASERRQARGREGEGARSSRAPRGARLSRGRTWRWST